MRYQRAASEGTALVADASPWAWQNAAACRGEGLELFFGPDGEPQPEREVREAKAKKICAECPVRTACGNYAIGRPEKYGTWGALNEDERDSERRRRQRRGLIPRKSATSKRSEQRKKKMTPRHLMGDATGPTRRLRAASAEGRLLKTFALLSGVPETTLSKIRAGVRDLVSPSDAQAIADAYPKVLALTHQVHRVPLQTAAKHGWHGPDAWTPDTIDDPTALPHVVERNAA